MRLRLRASRDAGSGRRAWAGDGSTLIIASRSASTARRSAAREIRTAIGRGDLASAERLLGRPVAIRGELRDRTVRVDLPMAMPPDGDYGGTIDGRQTSVTVHDGSSGCRPDGGRADPSGVLRMTPTTWHLAQLNVGRMLAPVILTSWPGSSPSSTRSTRSRTPRPGSCGAPDRRRRCDGPAPDRGRHVPHQHERVDVARDAPRLHVHHRPHPGAAPPARVVRTARERPHGPVVGAGGPHPDDPGGAGAARAAAPGRPEPRRVHVPVAVRACGDRAGEPLVDAEFCWPALAAS